MTGCENAGLGGKKCRLEFFTGSKTLIESILERFSIN
jgi:hypothetical protein